MSIYKTTVTPVTLCTATISVYTRGYSDGCDYKKNIKNVSALQTVLQVSQAALVGYCIGITYPIGIPSYIGYLYLYDAQT